MKREIEIGSLVYDASPYKAPEILYGIGIVIGTQGDRYVEVHWIQYSITSFENRENLEIFHESR